jgi:hypothetical protein
MEGREPQIEQSGTSSESGSDVSFDDSILQSKLSTGTGTYIALRTTPLRQRLSFSRQFLSPTIHG